MMLRLAAISLFTIFLAGPGRAVDFASPAALVAAMPPELRPVKGKPDKAKMIDGCAWMRDRAQGKTIAVTMTFGHSIYDNGLEVPQQRVTATCDHDAPPDVITSITASFEESDDMARMKKAKRGEVFTCVGTINEAMIGFRPATSENTLDLRIGKAHLQ